MFKVSSGSGSLQTHAPSETRWLPLTSAEVPHGEEMRINSASERGRERVKEGKRERGREREGGGNLKSSKSI